MKLYEVIYADPAWSYKSSGTPAAKRPCLYKGEKPHSVNHYYDTLTPKEIAELPIKKLSAKNSVLFMWVTNHLLPDAFDVMKAWGFKYKTCITWHKENGKGMGYQFRGHTEHLLFGVRGKVKAFRSLEHNIKKLPVGKHSEKPNEFRKMIENVAGHLGNKIELFARKKYDGWDVWGNEVENSININQYIKI